MRRMPRAYASMVGLQALEFEVLEVGWCCRSKSTVVLGVMVLRPHEMLQNHPIGIEWVQVQNKSCQDGGLLRVAASSNISFNTDALRRPAAARPCAARCRSTLR